MMKLFLLFSLCLILVINLTDASFLNDERRLLKAKKVVKKYKKMNRKFVGKIADAEPRVIPPHTVNILEP